jgi:hypothetical protein
MVEGGNAPVSCFERGKVEEVGGFEQRGGRGRKKRGQSSGFRRARERVVV